VIVQDAVAVALDLACVAVTLRVCWPGARFAKVTGEVHAAGAAESREHFELAPKVVCHANVALVDVVCAGG
jgi:hypothetical protein